MRRSGFTLIEVLIATAIFAVISAITFQGIQSSIEVKSRVEGRAQEFVEMQLLWTVLFQDFLNMTRRPIRVEGDSEAYPAFDLDPDDAEDCAVSFTRAGLERSVALPAGMQRLSYCLKGDGLYRVVWPVLDRPSDVESQESLLLEGVESFEVLPVPEDFDPYVEKTGSSTPAQSAQSTRKKEELPVAVRVVIEAGGQTFERWLPGGKEYKLSSDDDG